MLLENKILNKDLNREQGFDPGKTFFIDWKRHICKKTHKCEKANLKKLTFEKFKKLNTPWIELIGNKKNIMVLSMNL